MIRSREFQTNRARRPNSTRAQRANWVRRLRQSGLSQQAFARKHGLSASSLYAWIKQSAGTLPVKSPPAVSLREVSLPGLLSPWAAEVERPDGVTVRMSAPLARELLAGFLDSIAC
jgi:transposase-like protein